MRALFDTGPAADQDAIAAATPTVINNVSLTATERIGPILLVANIGFIDRDVLGVVTTLDILQEGVVIAAQFVETPAVDNLQCSATLFAVVENVAVGDTFQLRITPAGTSVDVKANNCTLMAIGLGQLGAETANITSP